MKNSLPPQRNFKTTRLSKIGVLLIILLAINSFAFSQLAPELDITKTGSSNANPGDLMTYIITYSNDGTDYANNVIVTDNLPDPNYYTYVSSSPAGIKSGNTITWSETEIPSLEKLGAGTYQIVVQLRAGTPGNGTTGASAGYYIPSTPATLYNSATISSDADANTDTSNIFETEITQFCGVEINNADGVIKSATGTSIYYLMRVSNTGNIYDNYILDEYEYICDGLSFDPLTASIEDLSGNVITETDWVAPGESYLFYLKLTTPTGSNPGRFSCRDLTAESTICSGTIGTGSTQTEIVGSVKGPIVNLSKIDRPTPVESGGILTYFIYLFNSNDKYDAYNTVITETYPAGVTFIDATPEPDAGTDNVWTLGTLGYGIGESKTVTVRVSVDDDNSCSGTLQNTVTASFDGGSEVVRTINSLVTSYPDMEIDLIATSSPDPAIVGGTINYTLNYSNIGNCDADNVEIKSIFDNTHTNISTNPDGGSVAGSEITWSLGTQSPGASGSVSFSVTIDASATFPTGSTPISNTATISTTVFENEYNNNFDTEVIYLTLRPDLAITKSISDPITPDENKDYTITVTNNGFFQADNVVVVDVLPSELDYISSSDGGSESGGTVTWNISTLPIGESKTLTLTVNADCTVQGTSVTNTVSVTNDYLA